MKPLVALLVFLLPTLAKADCAPNGIYPLSASTTLHKNGLIILEFYASSQLLVPELNKKYPAYLQSGTKKVALKVVEVLKGEFEITQVVFKPAADLKENETYILHLDNLPNYERPLQRYNNEKEKWEAMTLTITPAISGAAPAFLSQPAESKKTMVRYGCGPARWVYFSLAGQNKAQTWVRTRVKNLATGKLTEYILPIENGQVMVGHGMCSGAFHFDKGNEFEVSFALMDFSGNSSEFTKAIAFTAPASATTAG